MRRLANAVLYPDDQRPERYVEAHALAEGAIVKHFEGAASTAILRKECQKTPILNIKDLKMPLNRVDQTVYKI